MDQRRSKALTAFLVLVLLMVVSLLFLNYKELSEMTVADGQHALGVFSFSNEVDEATVVEGFQAELDEAKIAEGKRLEEKYGYSFRDTRQQEQLQEFLRRSLWIVGFSCLLLLFIWRKEQLTQRRLRLEMLNLSDRFEEEQRRNEVLLNRKKSEEENVKAVITDIAHQLKTPIASLKMSMEIAGSEEFSTEERRKFWEQGSSQIDKLDLMLDSLVRLSHLEAELISLKPQAYSIQALLSEVINSLIMKALDKEMEIEVEIPKDCLVSVDRKWTVEAISNILENAIKYAPKGTRILVKGTCLPSYALIEVLDEGDGIPIDEVNLIYRRFYRGNDPHVLENEGSGVGLYLARKIIEEQGGVILMKNRHPHGACFQITIPLELSDGEMLGAEEE